jgi:hypothetical protein
LEEKIMRYEVTTTLAPQAAIAYAKNYFGPQGIGLEVIDEHETSVTLMGGGGHVSVVACSGEKKTTLELETREWDYPVRQFRSLAKINYPFTPSGAGCNSTHHGTSPA